MTTDESDAEDDRLLARDDLGALFARHYDDLVVHARVRMGAAGAEDVVQAAILRTLRELQAGRTYPIPFRAVVHQHLRWACGDAFGEATPGALPEGWDVADPHAADAYEAVDARLFVEDVLATLPPGDRRVMSLRVIDGLGPEQIAGALGMTRNAVDQALWRARRAIGQEWAGG